VTLQKNEQCLGETCVELYPKHETNTMMKQSFWLFLPKESFANTQRMKLNASYIAICFDILLAFTIVITST